VNQSPHQDAMENKITRVMRVARAARSQALDWASFYRAVLGPGGIVRRMFPDRESLDAFERSAAWREIQAMLTELRRHRAASRDPDEPTTMITVRLPASLRHALRTEAFERRTTLNKLCISKLLQWIDQDMVPDEAPDPRAETKGEDEDEQRDELGPQPKTRAHRSPRRRSA